MTVAESLRGRPLAAELLRSNHASETFVRAVGANEKLVRLADVARRSLQSGPLLANAPRAPERHASRALGALFGPIRVNPHSERRTKLILSSYVFGTGGLPQSYEGAVSINGSAEEVDLFARQIVDRARALDYSIHHTGAGRYRRFDVVIGERGVGKTFFQNFLLSKYSGYFDTQRVLFVRINLLRDFYRDDGDINIDHWVKSQIAKIICRYYDSDSPTKSAKPPDLQLPCTALVQEGLSKVPFDEGKVREKARHMLSVFRLANKKAEVDIDSRMVDPIIADTIFQAVVETLHMAVIVVVDGLDLLGYTEVSKARYLAVLKALRTYLSSDAPSYRYHLIFVRPETRDDLEATVSTMHTINPDLDGNPSASSYFGLRPVNTSELLRRRFVALSDPDIAQRYQIDLNQLANFNRFLTEAQAVTVGPGGARSYSDAVAQIGGSNARCCVQLLQLAYHSYTHAQGFSSEEFTKSYQLTEMMMLAGHESPPPGFHYRYDQGGEIHKSSVLRLYESDFLPSVFRAPIVEGMTATKLYRGGDLGIALLPLRVLQLVQADTKGGIECGGGASSLGIRDLCKEIFGYSDADLQRGLEELIEEELIHPSARVDVFVSPGNQLLRLSPKGRLILEYFVNDPTYLGLACYNLPVPESMVHDRFFRNARPGLSAAWIVAKVWNSFSLYRIVAHINKVQREGVRERSAAGVVSDATLTVLRAAEAGILPSHGGLFSFVERMETRLLDVGGRILESLTPDTELYREVRRQLDEVGDNRD